jgi:hypothetical protein
MRPFLRRVLRRALTRQHTNVQVTQPLVWLRLRAARMAQVSFVEFEVPNKP